jgi:hypothetical protein
MLDKNKKLKDDKKKLGWQFKIGIFLFLINILIIHNLDYSGDEGAVALGFSYFIFAPLLIIGLILVIISLYSKRNKINKAISFFLILFLIWTTGEIYFPSLLITPIEKIAINTTELFCEPIPTIFSMFHLNFRDECLNKVANAWRNVDICHKIHNFYTQYTCYKKMAVEKKDESICDRISAPAITGFKDDCYIAVSKEKKDPNICGKIIDEYFRKKCYETY